MKMKPGRNRTVTDSMTKRVHYLQGRRLDGSLSKGVVFLHTSRFENTSPSMSLIDYIRLKDIGSLIIIPTIQNRWRLYGKNIGIIRYIYIQQTILELSSFVFKRSVPRLSFLRIYPIGNITIAPIRCLFSRLYGSSFHTEEIKGLGDEILSILQSSV